MRRAFPLIPSSTDQAGAAPVWIDLISPSDDEIAEAAAAIGQAIPTYQDLSEIETSSRLRARGDVLVMSTPLLTGSETPEPHLTPVGFLLSASLLVTVRFAPLKSFDEVADVCDGHDGATSQNAFLSLLEEVVDRQADHLERVGAGLEHLARETFIRAGAKGGKGPLNNTQLKLALAAIGDVGARLSMARDVMLGVGRIAGFVMERGQHCVNGPEKTRLNAIRLDVASLDDFETHLSNKAQFLLDAVLGLINVAQNDLFKVLTIVSVIGIPPTLIASMYGMNFRHMPELAWTYGYPWAIGLIVISTLAPLAWFKWRGWM
jgi:magnesium transporter